MTSDGQAPISGKTAQDGGEVRSAPWLSSKTPDQLTEQIDAMFRDTAFVREGHITVRGLGWEGQGPTIPPGESGITALCLGVNGVVYGATSGERTHVFRFDPWADAAGPYAHVIDLGVTPGMTSCDLMLTLPGDGRVLVAGRPGGCFVHDPAWEVMSVLDFHALPAPPFSPQAGEQLRPVPLRLGPGEALVAGVWSEAESVVYAVTHPDGVLLRFAPGRLEVERLAKVGMTALGGPLAVDWLGRVYGPTERGGWFRFDPDSDGLEWMGEVPGERGRRSYDGLCSLVAANGGHLLYGGTIDGCVFAFHVDEGRVNSLGRPTMASQVCGLVVLPDGRLVGAVGAEDEMAHLFVYEPLRGGLRDLGIMRSAYPKTWVVHRVGSAVAGPNGEVFLGENDRLGHLVIYHPALLPTDAVYGANRSPQARQGSAAEPTAQDGHTEASPDVSQCSESRHSSRS